MSDENGQNTRLYLDLPVIDVVIRAIVESRDFLAELWRIHRRAESGKVGSHQITFRVYTTKEEAKRINQEIAGNPLLKKLTDGGWLNSFNWEEESKNELDLLTDRNGTSDKKNWPVPFQDCWPDFAMGFSKSLLGLLKSIRESKGKSVKAIGLLPGDEIIAIYEHIDKDIADLWRVHGAGTFLHQAHAVFGYPKFEAFLANSTNQGQTSINCIHSPKHLK